MKKLFSSILLLALLVSPMVVSVDEITLKSVEFDSDVLKVTTSAPVKYNVFKVEKPSRLAVDLILAGRVSRTAGAGEGTVAMAVLAGTTLGPPARAVGTATETWVWTWWPPSRPSGNRERLLFDAVLPVGTMTTVPRAEGFPSPRHAMTSERPMTRGALSIEPTCSSTRLEAPMGSSWETRKERALSSRSWDSARKRLTTRLRIPRLYARVPI